MPPRETIVVPLGLVTEPNEYGQYPAGALRRADNVVMRSPGNLSQLPERTIVNIGPFCNDTYNLFMTSDKGMALAFVMRSGVHKAWWYDVFGLATGTPPITPADAEATFEDTLNPPPYNWDHVPRPVTMRGRVVVEGGKGIIVGDKLIPLTDDDRKLRYAGLPQPVMYALSVVNAGAGLAVTADYVHTCAATIERKYADGYILISDPSPLVRFKCPTAQGPCSIGMKVRFGPSSSTAVGRHGVRAGDVIKIWRSKGAQSSGANLNTESGTTLYLARTYNVIASDVNAGTTGQLVDDTHPDSLTEELYTNPGQESLQGMRRRPPKSSVHAVYQGVTWYANTTQPPFLSVRIPSGLGDLAQATGPGVATVRSRGIGVRSITGSTVAGSALVTHAGGTTGNGLAIGQVLTGNVNVNGKTIVSIGPGPNQFSMSGTAAATTTNVPFFSVDVIEIDGHVYSIDDLQGLLDAIGGGVIDPLRFYSIVTDQTVAYRENPSVTPPVYECVFNQAFALEPFRYAQAYDDGGFITVRASNGRNYDPPLPNMSESALVIRETREPNRANWSWDQQPEAVAPGNNMPIGKGEILAAATNRDALWFFCTDGLYRVTGYLTRSSGIGAQWSTELVDPTFVIAGKRGYCTLRDRVYAHGSLGFVLITPNGVQQLSAGIVGDLLFPNTENSAYYLTGDDKNNDIWIGAFTAAPAATGRMYYVYNAGTKAFTAQVSVPGSNIRDTAAAYATALGFMAFYDSAGSVIGIDQASAGRDATVDYQPLHADDPLAAKQWIDMVAILNKESADNDAAIWARFNGSDSTSGPAGVLVQKQNDARVTFGVPRNAPAIGHTLAPGLFLPGVDGVILVVKGISPRFELLSEQQVFRQAPP